MTILAVSVAALTGAALLGCSNKSESADQASNEQISVNDSTGINEPASNNDEVPMLIVEDGVHMRPDNIADRFGLIESRTNDERKLIEPMPNMPGLTWQSRFYRCKKDGCQGYRVLLALSCPNNPVLLHWMNKRLYDRWNPMTFYPYDNYSTSVKPMTEPTSAQAMCKHYCDEVEKIFPIEPCQNGALDYPQATEQYGMLIAPIWENEKLITFVIAKWFDLASNSHPYNREYVTIDKKSGEEYKLDHLISNANWDKMARYFWQHLRTNSGMGEQWANYRPEFATITEGKELMKEGVAAFCRQGLLFYWPPYDLGAGAYGNIISIVTWDEMKMCDVKFNEYIFGRSSI